MSLTNREATRRTTQFLATLQAVGVGSDATDAAWWAWLDSMLLRLHLTETSHEVTP